jgi:DNA-directed RNA polymerase specialized sigma24 family protein
MSAHRHVDGRSITGADLARLLARLGPDEEHAAREYERLRRTLIKFFDWRGAWPADECADQTIDRLARKLDETPVDDMWSYAQGIARLILLEHRRRPPLSSIEAAGEPAAAQAAPVLEENEQMHECFDRCLADLPSDSRSLILQYYEGDRSEKIATRRDLSATLQLSENALRSRVQRVRDRLELCIRSCVSFTGEKTS